MKIPSQSRSKVGFMMTPMVDVVFLLIIFFLVSSHLKQQERNTSLVLPVAPSGLEDTEPQRPRVTINVEDNGVLIIGGRHVPPQDLKQLLDRAREEKGDDFEVRIRASRSAVYASVEPVLIACTDAKIWNVTFAVFREEQQ